MQPVRENCLNCHDPHGSNYEYLLKVARPRLCHECHSFAHGTGGFGTPTTAYVLGRACGNCHSHIHGSNHPNGLVLPALRADDARVDDCIEGLRVGAMTMKMRAGLLGTCAASALVFSLGFASPVLAADMMPTKAPAAEPLPYWYYDGFAEIGYRFDLNGADKNTLGPFYKYRDLRPGVFGNFYFGAHRTNPIDFVLWGKNVGYDDQAFGLDFAKVGEHYLSLGWDETPHVYALNAKTTYSPLGGNVLSTPTYPYPPSAASQAFVNANSNTFNLGFRRDTATAKYRWTPTEAWDITADYSHLHREGTQSINAVSYSAPAGRGGADTRNPIELPKPVDDTTQNGNIKGEYAGSTPWGKPFNIALGAGFSLYNNSVGCGTVAGTIAPGSPDANCLTFQNPWNAANTATDPLWNRYSLFARQPGANF